MKVMIMTKIQDMTMIKLKIRVTLLILAFCCISNFLAAQEQLNSLQINKRLQTSSINTRLIDENKMPALWLPFKDDFSVKQNTPNNLFWRDKSVLINNDYCINPVTRGVATFDAIDSAGRLYKQADSLSRFVADKLTSRYIRLDSLKNQKLTASDSVYFSFYYQPQGYGEAPETNDSLVLEFASYKNDTLIWNKIWAAKGESLDSFLIHNNGNHFAYVSIPIIEDKYFTNKFYFRFSNYASLMNLSHPAWASNGDIWNIDYVYIDVNRRMETKMQIKDVAFIDNATSMLLNYSAMPWRQFVKNAKTETIKSFNLRSTNLSADTLFVHYNLFIKKADNTLVSHPKQINEVMFPEPKINTTFINYSINNLYTHFLGNTSNDYERFNIIHSLKEGDDSLIAGDVNDTTVYKQVFGNYFAYDDGIPEAGYGLSGKGSKLAIAFKLNTSDTLRAVRIYFNQTLKGTNIYPFQLIIWKNLDPEEVLYKQTIPTSRFIDSLNGFTTLELESNYFTSGTYPANALVDGTFYVGMVQSTNNNMNLGYDFSRNASKNIFYNSDGTWRNSIYTGSVMVRALLGKPLRGIAPRFLPQESVENNKINIFPNPVKAGDNIKLWFNDKLISEIPDNGTIEMFSLQGLLIGKWNSADEIFCPSVNSGVYCIRWVNLFKNQSYSAKVVIVN